MSWLDEAWSRRIPIAVDDTTGSGGTIDVEAVLPADWDDFWETVQADGDDIRLTEPDGRTGLTYNVSSWDSAARTGTIQIDAWAANGSGDMEQVWLYWGNSSAASGTAAVTITSAKTGHIELGRPAAPVVRFLRERPGDTVPRQAIAKSSGETIHLWWDVEDALEGRCELNESEDKYEEIQYVGFEVQSSGTPQAGMIDDTAIRYTECGGRRYVRTLITSGTDTTDYTGVLTITLTTGRVLEGRVLIQVRDTSE